MIVLTVALFIIIATGLSVAIFFGSTLAIALAGFCLFFFFDFSLYKAEGVKKIYFAGREIGETREGNNFIPLRKLLFRIEGEKLREKGKFGNTVRMALRLIAVFSLIGILIGGAILPLLDGAVQKMRATPTKSVSPGEYSFRLDPGEKTQLLTCRGRWSIESTGDIRFIFSDGYEGDYSPGSQIKFGPRNTFSVRNSSPTEEVTVFLSVF